LYWEREYREALKVLQDALGKDSKLEIVPDLRLMLGRTVQAEMQSLYLQGRYLDLVSLYNDHQVLLAEAALPEIRFTLAQAYMALGLPREAVELYQADVALPEHGDERLFGLAMAYYQIGRPSEASRNFKRFLERYSDHARVWEASYYLGLSLAREGRDQEAAPVLEEAARKRVELAAEGLYQARLGEVYFRLGRHEEAVSALQKASATLRWAPAQKPQEIFLVYAWMGRALDALGRPAEAAEALDTALKQKLETPLPDVLYQVAQAYFHLGRYDEGLGALDSTSKTGDEFWKPMADQEIKDRRLERELAAAMKSGVSSGQGETP
jgi:tetratricopeptide (TPR) repeat protein